jgi:hypothetical protein
MTVDAQEYADLQKELEEAHAQMANWKRAFREIRNMCDASHWTAKRRWAIRDRCNKELGTPHGE